MVFEFSAAATGNMMAAFAKATGGRLRGNTLTLPTTLGTGSVRGYSLGASLKLMIHQYTLQEELVFRRLGSKAVDSGVAFTYYDAWSEGDHRHSVRPSVQVNSSDLLFETRFSAHTPVCTIVIAAERTLLLELLNGRPEHPLLHGMLEGEASFVYEEPVSAQMRQVAAALIAPVSPQPLPDFYLRLRAEELLYLFFTALLQRRETARYPLHAGDVDRIYSVRDTVVADLSIPPELPQLAHAAGLSESKMKRLFHQVFGSSIYAYYQALRMEEAARLIRVDRLSVAEAGYTLGFTNLSHFARLFAKHTGLNPKKYALRTGL